MEIRHLATTIDRSAADVYAFASDPANLPQWAAGVSGSIERVDDQWITDSPLGRVSIRFAEPNDLGVLDHWVTVPGGETFYNPMRVFPNGDGAEVVFSLLRLPGVEDDAYQADEDAIVTDLATLKRILEER